MKKQTGSTSKNNVILRVLALPLFILILLIEWIGTYLNQISGIIFGVLSTIFWVIALICWVVGVAGKMELGMLLEMGFIVFIIPYIGEWIIDKIETAIEILF